MAAGRGPDRTPLQQIKQKPCGCKAAKQQVHDERHTWCPVSGFWAAAGMLAEKVDLMPLLRKRASLIGSTLRSRSLGFKADLVRDLSEDFKAELKQGSIKPPIDKVYPWDSVADAHARMAASHHFGKILLSMKAT